MMYGVWHMQTRMGALAWKCMLFIIETYNQFATVYRLYCSFL